MKNPRGSNPRSLMEPDGESATQILYWGQSSGRRPRDFVRPGVPVGARQIVAAVLSSGRDAHPGWSAKGWANCRICGRQLGTGDLTALGLVWPERAEHYVLEHHVWTPGCSELLRRIATSLGVFRVHKGGRSTARLALAPADDRALCFLQSSTGLSYYLPDTSSLK